MQQIDSVPSSFSKNLCAKLFFHFQKITHISFVNKIHKADEGGKEINHEKDYQRQEV